MSPISSSEIAQLNASYQSMAMQQQSYAASISQGNIYGSSYQGQGGDRVMSSFMNTSAAVGAPLAAGAMGLMGLDPVSLGLSAGMGAYAAGGIGGAAMAAGAVALPAMALGGAVRYAGGQMMQGAQQQMALNQDLRAGFNFRNQHGGQGFDRSQMSSIGEVVRAMSEQFGPGGEIASFKELSGLAGKMGAMGFAQGVKDVKDFTSRFKEMVKTLKTMATDLGTTLEGAMEFAQAAKNSGVFGMNKVAGFTQAARAATVSGGLAMSEVTGAASIGSQISRSIGGTGRQGAMAGVRTIGQIGTAQQMGILSEEDIYNVTGLTGAEGRQAYAASSLSKAGDFLQSGKGRRLLASIAGKNGTLDETAVQQLLSGGMSISETMRQDREHVTGAGAPVNRANFIRNEGRLRGAALERIGAFLPALQMKEWAESKGVNFDDEQGRDRAMLFAQRQLRMGRDDADDAIKMAQELPRIMAEQARSDQRDKYVQAVAQTRKGQGIEGLKQRFDQAKALVNGKLEKVGQAVFDEGAESINSFFDKLFGSYEETYSKDIDQQYRAMMRGGASGAAAGRRAFGISATGKNLAGRGLGLPGPESLASALAVGSSGDLGTVAGNLFKSSAAGMLGGMPGFLASGGGNALSEAGQYILHGQSGVSKLAERGINIRGLNDSAAQAKLQALESAQLAAATGFNEADVKASAGSDWLQKVYSRRDLGQNEDRIKGIKEEAERVASDSSESEANRASASHLLSTLNDPKASLARKAAAIASVEQAGGGAGKQSLANKLGLGPGGVASIMASGKQGNMTPAERNEALAKAAGIGQGTTFQQITAGLAGSVGGLFGGGMGANFATHLMQRYQGTREISQQAGKYMQSEEFRDIASDLSQGSDEDRAAVRKKLRTSLQDREEGEASGVTEVQRALLAGEDLKEWKKSHASATEEEQQGYLDKTYGSGKMSLKTVQEVQGGKNAALAEQWKANIAEEDKRIKADAAQNNKTLALTGVMDAATGKLTSSGRESVSKFLKGDEKASAAVNEYLSTVFRQGKEEETGGFAAVQDRLGRTAYQEVVGAGYTRDVSEGEAQDKKLESMSVQQLKAIAAVGGEKGSEAGYQASIRERAMKSRKGRTGTVVDLLGLDVDQNKLKALGDNKEAIAAMLAEQGGGAKEDYLKALSTAGKDKGMAGLGAAISAITRDPEFVKKQKEKKDKADEAKDPIETAVRDNTKRANELLTEIARKMGVSNDLLVKNASGNPESTASGGGAQGTKTPGS